MTYKIAEEIRRFEISLFWTRSLFFAGFVSLIFTGYGVSESSDIRFVLSVLGLFVSVIWLLANYGSKYWQENWEGHLDQSKIKKLFRRHYISTQGGVFGSWRGSPSKLAIVLSFYMCLVWGFLIINNLFNILSLYPISYG